MVDKIQIGERWVGKGEPTFVIAEIGANHDQKFDQAKKLIDAAAISGVDAVKFQTFSADNLYPAGTNAHAAVRAVELPRHWIPELNQYAKQKGLIFFASPFDNSGVDSLAEVDTPAFKIASSEPVNLPLMKHIASKGKPVLLSTGMCDLADIHEAIEVIYSEGNFDVALFQCTSLYPTEPRHSHIRAMETLRVAFQLPVGLSDHTPGIHVSAAAVALGACMIEKTLTLSRGLTGPDHGYALEPHEFSDLVNAIRITEEALGSPIKKLLPEEAEVARRDCIRAARNIKSGESLTAEMLTADRPAFGGIRPRLVSAVIGRTAKTDIIEGEPITWNIV